MRDFRIGGLGATAALLLAAGVILSACGGGGTDLAAAFDAAQTAGDASTQEAVAAARGDDQVQVSRPLEVRDDGEAAVPANRSVDAAASDGATGAADIADAADAADAADTADTADGATASSSASAGAASAGAATTGTASASPATTAATTAEDPDPPRPSIRYTIQYEDTLGDIAKRFGTTVQAILDFNAFPNPNVIVAGTEILVPVPADLPGPRSDDEEEAAVAAVPDDDETPAVSPAGVSTQSPGAIGNVLPQTDGPGLARAVSDHNAAVEAELLVRIRSMSPADFSAVVRQLLVAMGFESVTATDLGAGEGIDARGALVVGNVVRTQMAVHAKQWQGDVPRATVQQVRGALGAHEQALIITTTDFSSGARQEAERSDASPVALMTGEQLVQLLIQYEILVQRDEITLLTLTP